MTPRSAAQVIPSRIGRRDRGSAGLEVVALLPIVIFVGSLMLQLGVAVWTTVAADTAVRSAARADTLRLDPLDAANSSLPGSLRVNPGGINVARSSGTVQVTLRIDIPRVSVLPVFTVQRDAVMPDIR